MTAHKHADDSQVGCPTEDTIRDFFASRNKSAHWVEKHMTECDSCRQLVLLDAASRQADDIGLTQAETLAYLRRSGGEEAPAGATEIVGTRLGRYVLLNVLGSGGIGNVYGAYDPVLDRKVAIKILRGSSTDADTLVAEGRALARITHPNIVTIYDVGADGGRGYISMEYVDGGSLGDHTKDKSLTPREIVALYRDAALGLAELHAAGFVHRDFKPSNVLVGGDGRVRVADFGLVTSRSEESNQASAPHSTSEHADITQTHSFVGTPAYMAPECFRAEVATPASDVFSLCVALHEAVHGQRPYRGSTVIELIDALERAPSLCDGDDKLTDILRTGLAKDPHDRYQDAGELAVALSDYLTGSKRRRRIAVAVFFPMVVMVAVVTTWMYVGQATDSCESGRELGAKLWSDNKASSVTKAFTDIAGDPGRVSSRLIDQHMSAYNAAWMREHRSVCEATNVHGKQSAALLDRRIYCLERDYDRAYALYPLFVGEPNRETVANAVAMVLELQPPHTCGQLDPESLAQRPPVSKAERVRALTKELHRAQLLLDNNEFLSADEILVDVLPAIEKLEVPRLHAYGVAVQARLVTLSRSAVEAEALWRKGISILDGPHDEDLRAMLWRGLVISLREAEHVDQLKVALSAFHMAAANLPQGHVRRFQARFEMLKGAGKAGAEIGPVEERSIGVIRDLRRLLAAVKSHGYFHEELEVRALLGDVLEDLGRENEALGEVEVALALIQQRFDGNHALLGGVFVDKIRLLRNSGRHEEAAKVGKTALARLSNIYTPSSPRLLRLYDVLGLLNVEMGNASEGFKLFHKALSIASTIFGAEHSKTVNVLVHFAQALGQDHKPQQSVELLERARAILENKMRNPRLLSIVYRLLGHRHSLLRQHSEALRFQEQAVKAADEVGGPHAILTLDAKTSLAYSLQRAGQDLGKRSYHQRAVTLYQDAIAAWTARDGRDQKYTVRWSCQVSPSLIILQRYEEGADNARRCFDGSDMNGKSALFVVRMLTPCAEALFYASGYREAGVALFVDIRQALRNQDVERYPALGHALTMVEGWLSRHAPAALAQPL